MHRPNPPATSSPATQVPLLEEPELPAPYFLIWGPLSISEQFRAHVSHLHHTNICTGAACFSTSCSCHFSHPGDCFMSRHKALPRYFS